MKITKDKKILCIILFLISFLLIFTNKKNSILIIDNLSNNSSTYSNSMVKVMIESYYGSNEYREFNISSLSSNLYFNKEYSYCNNNSLSYVDSIVYITTNPNEYCYLYFDIKEESSSLLNLNIVTDNTNYNAEFFSSEVYDYDILVNSGTTSVEIRASVKGSEVVIDGAGIFELNAGYNTKEITVTENDKEYAYNITIYVPVNEDSLANYIINNASKDTLIKHTSSLEYGAADNKYRYSGEYVDNYICFGVSKCSLTYNEEYLYRIIEIDPDTGYIKVIKNSVYDEVEYDNSWNNNYSSSSLNTFLNTTFLESFTDEWTSLIVAKDWDIYGATWTLVYTNLANAKDVYDSETSSTYEVKVGLMNIYDYAYSTESSFWSYPLYYYGDEEYDFPSKYSWLYQGYSELTIARSETFTYSSWYIQESGNIRDRYVKLATNIRPVFYLSSAAKYLKGDGTSNNPYIISIS